MKTAKPKLPFSVAIGIIAAFGLLLTGATMEGTQIGALLNPAAVLMVFGGTIGATFATVGGDLFLKNLVPGIRRVLQAAPPDWEETAIELTVAADIARRDSLMKLEDQVKASEDAFMAQGYQLAADGTEEHIMQEILWSAAEAEHAVIRNEAEIWTKAGGYAPTLGIIGTVVGLVHALSLLSTPSALGPAIAAAFMATFYGVSSANLVFLPIGERLYALGREQEAYRSMIIAGFECIRRSDSMVLVAERLASMVPTEMTGEELKDLAKTRRSA